VLIYTGCANFDDYLEQEEHDKKIMETDTSTMDNESQLYFQLKQKILVRHFGSRQ
jgi:hypothetical protein